MEKVSSALHKYNVVACYRNMITSNEEDIAFNAFLYKYEIVIVLSF